jgi:hypothetical protein
MQASTSSPAVQESAPTSNQELRPLEEFEGEARELFLRALFSYSAAFMRDFKTGDPKIDVENDDGPGEQFQLEWLLTRALFASYAAMRVLNIEPKRSVTEKFSEEVGK